MVAKSGSRTAIYIVVGVLVAVVLVVWGVFQFSGGGSTTPVAGTYTTTLQDSVVVAGKAAPTTVDIYEDFLCPICGRFESSDGADITSAINAGKIQVRYHPVAILNRATNPTGYSLRAANAGVCAAEGGVFPAYHDKLFAQQPSENSAGLTDQQLIDMGTQVKAPATFANCVTSGKYSKAVTAETSRAAKDTSLRAAGASSFGTPSVTINGKRAEPLSDGNWLTNVTK